MEMTKILLLTHGEWGQALINSVRMIMGETDGVVAIPLMPEETLTDYYQKVRGELDVNPRALVITDLFGGTPSNVAARLSQDFPIQVIAGLNAPMLMDAIMTRTLAIDDADRSARIVETGSTSCLNVVNKIKANMGKE
ncbi:PTS sugar transporter subunit IIA [Gottschalkiaceae bacterium SANA]|nr:PTS sugar transporter subunit IIA [Gottschalkiaceae bacterium SANA]